MSFLKNSKLWAYLALALSLACIATILYAIMGVRSGWESMGYRDATTLIGQALSVGIWLCLIAALALGYSAIRKQLQAVIVSLVALILVAAPVAIDYANQPEATDGPRAPPLNDISTDTQNPPLFDAVAAVRPEGSNTLVYPENGPELQANQFPDIQPIRSSLSKADAFARALEVVDSKGWELVAENLDSGIIEAVSSTPVFSFEDDVVIRVTEVGSGSLVDIRSHSRVGRGDGGVNAARVRGFIDSF